MEGVIFIEITKFEKLYGHVQVVDTELFKCLQEIHGEDYHTFVASKLVPVVGNVREFGVGIAKEIASEITEEVDIIVNMAANTTFDERFVLLYTR
jgi:fatty acyl-CoA reductase